MTDHFYNRFYSVAELYGILFTGMRSMPHLARARRSGILSPDAIERVMLAVTEVNGCEVCSYVHARMALERGMSAEEVHSLLQGDTGSVPAAEALGIAFAQHYADSRGRPSRDAWQRVVDACGLPKALGILGAARTMMIGNAYGIAMSAFASRLKGKSVARSSLGYELAMLSSIVVLFPVALLHALAASLAKVPIISVAAS